MSTHVFKISLYYDEKWEIKLCISVNIYRHFFKIDKKWEIKLCIQYETWYEYSFFQNYGL